MASLSQDQAEWLKYDWNFWGRDDQLAPPGDWNTWLVLAGRGWGKTKTLAQWVIEQSNTCSRIALVAPTAADCRDVLIGGESGIIASSPPWNRPLYEPSKRGRLTWPNGAQAFSYSAEEPDRLRGPQHSAAACDEAAAWKYPETMDMLEFGLRLGENPRRMVTTTPKPIPIIKGMIADQGTIVTRGSTYDNIANLAPSFIRRVITKYEGTRLGRQELRAEILDDVPGALWTRAMLDAGRVRMAPPALQRVVVGVDPSGTSGDVEDKADDVGIVVAALGYDGRCYVLADRTCHLSPAGWARIVCEAVDEFAADRVVAERNFGGAMVEHTLRTARATLPIKVITASRGKVARAEPVAALFEQGKVSMVGALAHLEDQMCNMTSGGYLGGGSPDRLDAMVWTIHELMVDPTRKPTFAFA